MCGADPETRVRGCRAAIIFIAIAIILIAKTNEKHFT